LVEVIELCGAVGCSDSVHPEAIAASIRANRESPWPGLTIRDRI
jgi:hypothetical protein